MTDHAPNLDGVQDVQDAAQDAAQAQTLPDTHDGPHDAVDGSQDAEDAETFPRSYVEKLRKENQTYRDRAKRADDLAHRLHGHMVAATGRLADPSDLPFDDAHLDDPDALTAALDDLLARKPHLASRRPVGSIGQGAAPTSETVDLSAILRAGAR